MTQLFKRVTAGDGSEQLLQLLQASNHRSGQVTAAQFQAREGQQGPKIDSCGISVQGAEQCVHSQRSPRGLRVS